MEEARSVLLETLPRFLEQELANIDLTLEQVPLGLQEVVFHRAETTGRLDRLQPRHCEELVSQVLDDLFQEQFQVLCRKPGGSRQRGKQMMSLLLVRTQYLASLVDELDISAGSEALDCLADPGYLKAVCPPEIPPALLKNLVTRAERLMDARRKQSGSVTRYRRQGFQLLAVAIWDAYEAVIPTILSVAEPQAPPTPPPPPDVWRSRFAQRFEQAYAEPPPAEIAPPIPESAPSPIAEMPPLEEEPCQPPEQDDDTEIVARLRQQIPAQEIGRLVPRTALLDSAKAWLLASDGPALINLWGTAGVGKTALLQMLGHDPEVQAHFDFLLWAALGPEDDRARAKQREQLLLWANALSLPAASLSTVELLSQAVQERLQERRVLVLLDDVWSGESIRPLLAGGRAVLTTRNWALLERQRLDHEIVAVPPMSLAEAQALVQQGTGQEIDQDDPRLHALHEQTDGLPQALRVAVSRIGEMGWEQALKFLGEERSRLPFLERGEGRSRADSLRASFAVSYQRLRPEQQHLFRCLGTFALSPVSAGAVHAVWQATTEEATELELRRLADLSLVQDFPAAEGPTLFYLTELWRDYARQLLRDSGELEAFEQRYVADQVQRVTDLRRRFHTFGEDTTQVMRDFYEAVAHIDYAYRLANRQRDVARLHQLLVDCPLLLIHAGWIDIWQEWLTLPEPWLGQAPPGSDEHRALLVEWQLQRTDLLLEQGQAREAVNVLNGIRRLCRHDPGQEANRQLALASAALQLGQTRKARRCLEGARKLRAVRQSPLFRFRLHSLEARLAREGRIPLHVVDAHGQAILACRMAGNQASELVERLSLAESLRQFGWVEKAAAQLEHVAVQAGQLELGYLYALSLVRLVHLHLDRGDVGKADQAMDWLRPLGATEELAPLEARLRDTPPLQRDPRLERWPEFAQRIVVVGPPGSGKTALARDLAQQLGWPHVVLDRLYWPAGWRPVPAETFREHTLQALDSECWVVDGDHWQVRDVVWGRADLVLWLNYSPWQVLRRIARREKVDHDDQPDDGALWLRAARALGAGGKEYPLALSLKGLEQLSPRIVHIVSPERAERWLSDFVLSNQRQPTIEQF